MTNYSLNASEIYIGAAIASDPEEPNRRWKSNLYRHKVAHTGDDWYRLVTAAEADLETVRAFRARPDRRPGQ